MKLKAHSARIWIVCCFAFFAMPLIAQDKASAPVIEGTFIQDNLVKGWDDARWQKEFSALKAAGMEYIILAPAVHRGKNGLLTAIYDSEIKGVNRKYSVDLVENCLRNAKRAGMKVFLGLNFDESWWDARFSEAWLYEQMELGNTVAEELIRKYKQRYSSTLYGWYWVWEVDNLHCKTNPARDVLANALNINLDYLHRISPDMPFMLCPFMNYRVGTANECRDLWQYVFAKTHFQPGDIFAPQDCVGAGGLELSMLPEWFGQLKQAVDTKPGLQFWSDAETFDQRFWTSAPLDRFVKQLELVQPYVSKLISFAYSHYYSPDKVDPQYHLNYLRYYQQRQLTNLPEPGMVQQLLVKPAGDTAMVLSWMPPLNPHDIVGYYVFSNGELVGNLPSDKVGKGAVQYSMKGKFTAGSNRFEVCTYTATGKVSKKQEFPIQPPMQTTLDNYTIPIGIKGAVIGKIYPGSGLHKDPILLAKDTAGIFRIDKDGNIRLKKNKALWVSDKAYRYGVTIKIGNTPLSVELVKDEFIHNKVVAHRGAWKNQSVSENSIGALKAAIQLGCEGAEFDVWMTKDSGIVIAHDPVIGGLTIEQSSKSAIQQVALKQNEFVPTLEQYLAIIQQQNKTRLFLEIKSSGISQERSIALADKVVSMVHDAKAQAWVSYISFNYGVLKHIRQLDPFASTAYLSGDKRPVEISKDALGGIDYPFYSFHNDKTLVVDAHHFGLSVNVWTVNDLPEMKFLWKEGVDLITTNEPETLLDWIKGH